MVIINNIRKTHRYYGALPTPVIGPTRSSSGQRYRQTSQECPLIYMSGLVDSVWVITFRGRM